MLYEVITAVTAKAPRWSKRFDSLYFFCDVGDEVPEEMYKAVAEVLAYVYNLKKRGGRI